MLTDAQKQAIRAHAAQTARHTPNAANPHPPGSEEAQIWETHFHRAMAALNE